MDNFIAFAEVASAIIAAMGLAMCLEWLTLSGLLRIMPPRQVSQATAAPASLAGRSKNLSKRQLFTD